MSEIKNKSANAILLEHGIDTMSLNDDFNTQLFHAMERYAEQYASLKCAEKDDEIKRLNDDLEYFKQDNFIIIDAADKQIKEKDKEIERLKGLNEKFKAIIKHQNNI